MSKTPLEDFLDITELQTNPDYVSNLLKTAYSKNITIEEWNTFINQFQSLISKDAHTYLGFKRVLQELQMYTPNSSFAKALGVPYDSSKGEYVFDPTLFPKDCPNIYSSVAYMYTHKADLGTDGKVLAEQLPSYVDDVLEYPTRIEFPTEGELGKIYVDIATGKAYRWAADAKDYIIIALGDLPLEKGSGLNSFQQLGNQSVGDHSSSVGLDNYVESRTGTSSGWGNRNEVVRDEYGKVIHGDASMTHGRENLVRAHLGFAGGDHSEVRPADPESPNYEEELGANANPESDTGGYASIGYGNHVIVTGGGSAGFGTFTRLYARYGLLSGLHNYIFHDWSAVTGERNYTSRTHQTVHGMYANPNPKSLFTIGNGKSDTQDTVRSNAFEVLEDGAVNAGLNISGGKAFQFRKITFNSDGTGAFSIIHKDGSSVSLEEAPYKVGSYYSYILNATSTSKTHIDGKFDCVGTITGVNLVDGTVCVSVSKLAYNITQTFEIASGNLNECLFISVDNPNIGDVDIGSGASTFGLGNVNLGYLSLVSGNKNVNTGHYALIGGKKNTGGYGSLIGGVSNFAVSNYSVAGGSNHTVTGLRSAAFNLKNTVSHQNCTVVGSYNITTADNQLVGGTCANPSTTSLFTIGNGTKGSPSNAFEVISTSSKKAIKVGGAELTDNKVDRLNTLLNNVEIKNSCIMFKGNKVNATYGISLGYGTETGSGALATGRNSRALTFGSVACGDGLIVPSYYTFGTAAFGKFNSYVDYIEGAPTPEVVFMVGNGDSDTKRSNVFEVRKDKSIVIGDTKLTEAQLKSLLALI